jgi:hypothetical protein
MGKASRKKGHVQAKSRRSSRGFVAFVVAVFVVGVALIALAKSDSGGTGSATGPGPRINDHWHATVGVNLCGTWQANQPMYEPSPNTGIHSHGDGFIHMHPFSAAGAGSNATVGLFYRQAGDKLSATGLEMFKHKYKNGDVCDALDKKPGLVRWSVNGQERTGNPASFVPNDRDVVAIAFIPKDADIGTPPVAVAGTNPSDVSSQ